MLSWMRTRGAGKGLRAPTSPRGLEPAPDADGKMLIPPAGKTSSLELLEEDMEDSGMNHLRKIIPHSAKVDGK